LTEDDLVSTSLSAEVELLTSLHPGHHFVISTEGEDILLVGNNGRGNRLKYAYEGPGLLKPLAVVDNHPSFIPHSFVGSAVQLDDSAKVILEDAPQKSQVEEGPFKFPWPIEPLHMLQRVSLFRPRKPSHLEEALEMDLKRNRRRRSSDPERDGKDLILENMAMRTGDGVSRDPDAVISVGGGVVERTILSDDDDGVKTENFDS